MAITIVDIPRLGAVLFAKSKRAKRVSITIKADLSVRVAVPFRVSLGAARRFVDSKVGWAQGHLERLRELDRGQRGVRLDPVDREEAKAVLVGRLKELAEEYGFVYNRVFIRNQRTRWGSCSGKNNINLNMNLVRLPCELMDYVILHELVHTRIKNHSAEFWQELDRIVGDSKGMRKRMRERGFGLRELSRRALKK